MKTTPPWSTCSAYEALARPRGSKPATPPASPYLYYCMPNIFAKRLSMLKFAGSPPSRYFTGNPDAVQMSKLLMF